MSGSKSKPVVRLIAAMLTTCSRMNASAFFQPARPVRQRDGDRLRVLIAPRPDHYLVEVRRHADASTRLPPLRVCHGGRPSSSRSNTLPLGALIVPDTLAGAAGCRHESNAARAERDGHLLHHACVTRRRGKSGDPP